MDKLSFVLSKSGEELQIDTHGGASIAMLQRLVRLFSGGAFPTCSYGSSAWRVQVMNIEVDNMNSCRRT